MQNFPKLQKQYDHIIIGYNLAAMTFAYELQKRDESYCVLDAKHLGSSPIKRVTSLESLVSTRIAFNPPFETDETAAPIWGEMLAVEGPPTTFDKGDFKSFLGFGDSKVQAMEAVSPYCAVESVVPQLKPEDQWQKILDVTSDNIFLDQQVTDVEYDESAIQSLMLNGKTKLSGKNFYFFDHFDFLFDKMANEMKKQASQFAKLKWFSSVNLVIHHSQAPEQFEANQVYLLMGSKQQPCLGQFTQIKGQWVSRWESFFPAELAADSETTGTMLKEIKKQIKRAFKFPEGTEHSEHILMHDRVFADFEKATIENGKLSHFNNLYAYSPLFSGAMGWVKEILVGQQAVSDLDPSEKNPEAETIEVAGPGTPC